MAKRPLELLTESMFYVLMALAGGEKCGMEISAFLEQKSRGAVPMGPGMISGELLSAQSRQVP